MSEIKLKPCPFCGGEAVFGTVCRNWIKCKKCGYETEWTDDAQWLVDTWNTRKPMDDFIEEIARRDTTDGTVKVFSGREIIEIIEEVLK